MDKPTPEQLAKALNALLKLVNQHFRLLDNTDEVNYHYALIKREQAIQYFSGVSFPKLDVLANMNLLDERVMVLIASNIEKQEYYGCLIGNIEEKRSLNLKSFAIHPEFRKQQHGTKLLQQFEDLASKLGVSKVSVQYRTYWNSNAHWEHMLQQQGWSTPQLDLYFATMADANSQFNKNWLQQAKLPEGIEVEEWSGEARNALKLTLQQEDWKGLVPKVLDPFQMPNLVLPYVTLLLKKEEEIIGWIICHLLPQKVVQVTSLFMHPIKGKGLGLLLVAECVRRRRHGYRVNWVIEKDNTPMLNLTKKYLAAGGGTNIHELRTRNKAVYI